jgi:hypothetical protein
MVSARAGPTTPVRNSTHERWPSPTARTLITNLTSPGARPLWSGWVTMDGLHSAADSTAYSMVK